LSKDEIATQQQGKGVSMSLTFVKGEKYFGKYRLCKLPAGIDFFVHFIISTRV
jgi:hypothetical protein